jgi:hypothetical protein
MKPYAPAKVNAIFISDKRIISTLYNICATTSNKASSEKKNYKLHRIVPTKKKLRLG